VARLREQFCDHRKAAAPSSAAEPTTFLNKQKLPDAAIYCNRPADPCRTLPLSLLHPVFGTFIDDYCSLVPTNEDKSLAFRLVDVMTPIYNAEKARQKSITKVLNDSGIDMKATKVDDYTTAGDVSYNLFKYLIAEIKHDIGSKGAEPYMQGCLYYLESTRGEAPKHSSSSLPCLLMLIFGMEALFNHIYAYIFFFRSLYRFAGAIWTDRPNVQMLTPAIPCHYHRDDVIIRDATMRQIRRAMVTLENNFCQSQSPIQPSRIRLAEDPGPGRWSLSGDSGTQVKSLLK
jgi:hypothetical protein